MDKFNTLLNLILKETTWNTGYSNIPPLNDVAADLNIPLTSTKKLRGPRHKKPIIRDFGITSKGFRKHVRTIAKSQTVDASKKTRVENLIENKSKSAIVLNPSEYEYIIQNFKVQPEKGKTKMICRKGPSIYYDQKLNKWILSNRI